MRNFETDVQKIKYKVLRAVAEHALNEKMDDVYYSVPLEVIPGKKPTMRCCVYKERAIVTERVHNALGGEQGSDIIQVIDIACDECPVDRYTVSNACRGCLAHRCMKACPRNAITKGRDGKAEIDPEKCIHCGRCAKACPYGAITENIRPCERACKIGAIKMNDQQKAEINYEKCINCGACVSQCPFGAVVDNSYMVDAINLIKQADHRGYYTVAIIAPAIASQYQKASLGQVKQALRNLGFHDVVEAALGADMVAKKETKELVEKGFLTSSCCPAFVRYIQQHVPEMAEHISHNLSPMAEIGRYIKENSAWPIKTIFIGPCTAKKYEQKLDTVRPWIDCVITFEEMQALLDAAGLPPEEQSDQPMNDASYYGRVFGRSGGLTEAVIQSAKEQEVDFVPKAAVCSGIEQCKVALLKAKMGRLAENFIEGMACEGGCINGAGVINHSPKDKMTLDKYAKESQKEGINMSIGSYETKF
ncbi:MAG: 4Fe-4S dicluster domain-containing protein [Clostridia bacterium]|nr:4Fe-4S dicluster domain-containing protein [Clostridia bacterium]